MSRTKRPRRPKRPPHNLQIGSHWLDIQRKLGYVFVDPSILSEALQAAGNGVSQVGGRKIMEGNKRLAMLGDSVLQLALLNDWYMGGGSRGKLSIQVMTAIIWM